MAQTFIALLGIYLAIGVLFSVPFVAIGVARVDPAARGASWGFRMLILPAVVALWPLLARRWVGGRTRPEERNAHREGARRGAVES